MNAKDVDYRLMRRALELAALGQGHVEPNPMVGCVIANGDEIIAEGWHQRFGGPHAEVEALSQAGGAARGATMVVTLEPCSHQGKTPPCAGAIIDAGLRRVVLAMRDPFGQVDGGGIQRLRQAGVTVDIGLLEEPARQLNAPYLKLVQKGRPWIIAKWAMSLDGKFTTRSGESRWISSAASREIVHKLRGRVDAILVGRGTAEADDPLLTARPAGPRVATRVVCDSLCSLSLQSQLVRSANAAPVMVATSSEATEERRERIAAAGCEALVCQGSSHAERLKSLLEELGRRRVTNLLVEGGSQLLGSLFDAQWVDEAHIFIAPKIIGGGETNGPVAGLGVEQMADALNLSEVQVERVDGDLYFRGFVER